jgi:transcriptional regulator with XRE-family HTH domain
MQSPKSQVSTPAHHSQNAASPTLARWALIAARKAKGLTQADIAVALGVSRPTVSAIEQGRRDPTPSAVLWIEKCLGITTITRHERVALFAVTSVAEKLRTRRPKAVVEATAESPELSYVA